jgi:hypothetical protein
MVTRPLEEGFSCRLNRCQDQPMVVYFIGLSPLDFSQHENLLCLVNLIVVIVI